MCKVMCILYLKLEYKASHYLAGWMTGWVGEHEICYENGWKLEKTRDREREHNLFLGLQWPNHKYKSLFRK